MSRSIRMSSSFKETLARDVIQSIFVPELHRMRDEATQSLQEILDDLYSDFDWEGAEKFAPYIKWAKRVDISPAIPSETATKVSYHFTRTFNVWRSWRWLVKLTRRYPTEVMLTDSDCCVLVDSFWSVSQWNSGVYERIGKLFLPLIYRIIEVDAAWVNLKTALIPLNSYKQLREAFPELSPYYTTPDKPITALVSVEVIDKVRAIFKNSPSA